MRQRLFFLILEIPFDFAFGTFYKIIVTITPLSVFSVATQYIGADCLTLIMRRSIKFFVPLVFSTTHLGYFTVGKCFPT